MYVLALHPKGICMVKISTIEIYFHHSACCILLLFHLLIFCISHKIKLHDCVIYPEPSIITHMHGLSSVNVCQTDKTSYSPNCKSCISVSQIIFQYLSTGKGKLKATSISNLPWYHCYHFLSS